MKTLRRVALGLLAFVLAFVVFASYKIFGPRERVPGVVSIEAERSYQDPQLMARAFELPVARTYRDTVFQPNGSMCGPTSVANVERSLGRRDSDPVAVRSQGNVCPTGMCIMGLTLDELAGVARTVTRRNVRVLRGLDLPAFRALLRTTNDPSRRVVANFDRGPLFGYRGGHHSPVAGYLEAEDLALVIDVNQRYRPWLVSSARLHSAVRTVDSSTRQERGLLVIE